MQVGAVAPLNVSSARSLGARGSRLPVGHDDPAGDPGDAARSVLAAVPEWWAAKAASLGLTDSWLDVYQAIEDLEPAPTAADPADLSGLTVSQVGQRYVTALSAGTRARHGRHYTPDALADHLWLMARRSAGQRRPGLPLPGLVRDPACGAGALLLPPLRQHLVAMAEADPRVTIAGIVRVIEGVDADPCAAWLASIVLASELLPCVARIPANKRRPLPRLARVGDGLAPPARPARVVTMNPPYGRVRLDGGERERWSRYLYGHANLYGLFLAAGMESLDEDGVLAALVPTSFLAGRYFASLRGELARSAPLRDLTFVEERGGVFDGVLQETCLAAFTRRRARKTRVASVNGRVVDVANVTAPRGDGPWLIPRRSDDAPVAAAATKLSGTLRSAGWRVSTGPLVWNRRRDDLGAEPGEGRLPVVWGADLDGGDLHQDAARDTLRWFAVKPEEETTMVLDHPAILVQRTTAPEQARRVVSVELTPEALGAWGGAIVVENHVNVVRPDPGVLVPAISRSTLAAVLATATIDRVARSLSGSVALSAYELESLPLPADDELTVWEGLRGDALEKAVATAFGRKTS